MFTVFQRHKLLSTVLLLTRRTTVAFSSANTRTNTKMNIQELTISCSNGINLAAQSYTSSQEEPQRRILCLHGWMDNCHSFYWLAPYIMRHTRTTQIVALDFVGHGHSDHTTEPGVVLAEYVYYVAEALRVLKWSNAAKPITLVGHSMGAGVACLYAAAFPEHVGNLVLLEGGGPLARDPLDTAKHIRSHILRRLSSNRPPRIYDSIDLAISTRQKTATSWPGNQTLGSEAATQLVKRGVTIVDGTDKVQFRHDPRLSWPSIQYFMADQVGAIYKDVQCPTALLLAENGWPFDTTTEKNKEGLELLQPKVLRKLPGSHHFHMDPDTAELVAQEVVAFLDG